MNLLHDLRERDGAALAALEEAYVRLSQGDVRGAQARLEVLIDVMSAEHTQLPASIAAEPRTLFGRLLYLLRHYRVLFGDWGFQARIAAAKIRKALVYKAPAFPGEGPTPTDNDKENQ